MKKLKKFVVLCLAVIMLFTACGKKGEEVTKELSITQMQTICELATLKCYYHNVAKLTKEKEVLWWDTSAELWIEYSGIVKLGVDIANLDMQVDGDQVTITMPKAEVLSCQVDQTSLNEDSYYTTREGLGAEKINAIRRKQSRLHRKICWRMSSRMNPCCSRRSSGHRSC